MRRSIAISDRSTFGVTKIDARIGRAGTIAAGGPVANRRCAPLGATIEGWRGPPRDGDRRKTVTATGWSRDGRRVLWSFLEGAGTARRQAAGVFRVREIKVADAGKAVRQSCGSCFEGAGADAARHVAKSFCVPDVSRRWVCRRMCADIAQMEERLTPEGVSCAPMEAYGSL